MDSDVHVFYKSVYAEFRDGFTAYTELRGAEGDSSKQQTALSKMFSTAKEVQEDVREVVIRRIGQVALTYDSFGPGRSDDMKVLNKQRLHYDNATSFLRACIKGWTKTTALRWMNAVRYYVYELSLPTAKQIIPEMTPAADFWGLLKDKSPERRADIMEQAKADTAAGQHFTSAYVKHLREQLQAPGEEAAAAAEAEAEAAGAVGGAADPPVAAEAAVVVAAAAADPAGTLQQQLEEEQQAGEPANAGAADPSADTAAAE